MAKNSDAVMRGQTAAEAGEPRSACPWNKANMNTIHLRRDWLRGWDSVQERDEERRVSESIARENAQDRHA